MGGKRGFTLVEMTVVMAIVAILSLIGVSALLSARNNATVDNATQEIVSAIREAQNKAVSVESAPDGTVPVAWGIQVDSSAKSITPFYISYISPSTFAKNDLPVTTYNPLSSITVDDSPVPVTFFCIYSAPFGNYYGTKTVPTATSPWTWTINLARPHDSILTTTPVTAVVNVVLDLKGIQRTVSVAPNGDVNAQ